MGEDAAGEGGGRERPRCAAVVWRRDTYRRTGRTKSGFEMHYDRGQCERAAVEGGLCKQHAAMPHVPIHHAPFHKTVAPGPRRRRAR